MTRTLTLKREALAELSADDLSGVGGAAAAITVQGALTCPLQDCFIDSNMGMCYSWLC